MCERERQTDSHFHRSFGIRRAARKEADQGFREHEEHPRHPRANRLSTRLFQLLDLHWRSPESGVLWYKSRRLKRRFAPPLGVCGLGGDAGSVCAKPGCDLPPSPSLSLLLSFSLSLALSLSVAFSPSLSLFRALSDIFLERRGVGVARHGDREADSARVARLY